MATVGGRIERGKTILLPVRVAHRAAHRAVRAVHRAIRATVTARTVTARSVTARAVTARTMTARAVTALRSVTMSVCTMLVSRHATGGSTGSCHATGGMMRCTALVGASLLTTDGMTDATTAVGVRPPPYLLRHATLSRAPHHMTVDRRHAPTAAVLAARRTTNTLRTAAGGARCRRTIAPIRHAVMVTMRRRHAVNVMDTASDSTGRRIG